MSFSKHRNKPSYDFSEEILSEIFKRLPVKYVLRCGCVQKSWYHLIRTRFFVSLHSNYQKITSHLNPEYLLFHNVDTRMLTLRLDDAQCQVYCNHLFNLKSANTWFAQSNGLLCVSSLFDHVYDYSPDISLLNPLVNKSKRVPRSPLSTFKEQETQWKALAFGFLPEENDYVVVHIVKHKITAVLDDYDSDQYELDNAYEQYYAEYPHSVEIAVYSLNTNSWKKVCQDKVFVDCMGTNKSVFVNGTAFWVGSDRYEKYQSLLYFDTKTNILREIEVPSWIALHDRQFSNPLILPFGQSIAYFVEVEDFDADEDESPRLDIWIFKENMIDAESSWEKKMSVNVGENVSPQVWGIRNNGDPILTKLDDDLISYDLDIHEPYAFVDSRNLLAPEEVSTPFYFIRPFVETLVFLDLDLNR